MESAKDYQYYMNTYGYLTLGIFLTIVNFPVLVVVTVSKEHRKQYGVLIISLVNGLLSGFGTIGYGTFRLMVYSSGTYADKITLEECFQNVSVGQQSFWDSPKERVSRVKSEYVTSKIFRPVTLAFASSPEPMKYFPLTCSACLATAALCDPTKKEYRKRKVEEKMFQIRN
uniref:G_PROTEIN_RECEP_F1_2 domain-containing protein n=1 Tax=Steinernema glaseri TaxID=37863 RepID=A0A1I7ZVV4_9BILA